MNIHSMKKTIQALCLFAINIAVASAHVHTKSNCNTREDVFFSCAVGAKRMSICSPKGEADDYLEYRFGTPKRIELRFKGTLKDVPRKFSRAEITGASNSGTTLWFLNRGTHYVLNAPVRGGPYLDVINEGKRISRLTCKGQWTGTDGDLDAPSKAITAKTQETFFSEVLKVRTK